MFLEQVENLVMLDSMGMTEGQDMQEKLAEADPAEMAAMATRMARLEALGHPVVPAVPVAFEEDMAVEAELERRGKVDIPKALTLNLSESFE